MSDQLTNKEKAIKGLLQGHEPSVNTDDIWLAIEGNLPAEPQRKRRLLPIWWLMGLMLLVGVVSIAGYLLSSEQEASHRQSTVETLTSADISEGRAQNTSVDVAMETNTVVPKETAAYEATATSMSQLSKSEMTSASGQSSASKAYVTTEHQESRADRTKFSPEPTIIIETNDHYSSQKPQKVQAEGLIDQGEDTPLSIPFLEFVQRLLDDKLRKVQPTIALTEPVKRQDARLLALRVTGGLMQSISSASVSAGSEFDPIHLQREADRVGTDIGIDLGTAVRGWTIHAGLGYNRAITQYRRSDVSSSIDVVSGTSHILIDADGNSTAVTGDVEMTTTTYHDLSWYRRHSTVELRAGLGKDLYRSGMLSLGVEGTMGYAISSSHCGYQFEDQAEAFTKLEEAQTSNYRKNMGWSAALSLPVALHLRSTTLAVAPTYRYQGSTTTTTDNFYQIKNSQIGIQFSITYQPRWEQF